MESASSIQVEKRKVDRAVQILTAAPETRAKANTDLARDRALKILMKARRAEVTADAAGGKDPRTCRDDKRSPSRQRIEDIVTKMSLPGPTAKELTVNMLRPRPIPSQHVYKCRWPECWHPVASKRGEWSFCTQHMDVLPDAVFRAIQNGEDMPS